MVTGQHDFESTKWSPARVASAFALVRDGLIVVDPSDVVLHANPPAAERLGAPHREIVGKSLHELVPGLVESGVYRHLTATRSDGVARTVEEYVPLLGGWFSIDASVGEGDDSITVVVREFTETRRAEVHRRIATSIDAAVAGSTSMNDAVQGVVAEVRAALSFDVGEAWLHTPGHEHLQLVAIDHDRTRPDLEPFVTATRSVVIAAASPLLETIRTNELSRFPDLGEVRDFALRDIAAAAGLRASLHAHIDVGPDVSVVIGLYRNTPLEADDSTALLDDLRLHVATVLSRHRATLEVRQLFELTRDYVSITGFDGKFRRVNPAMAEGLGFSDAEFAEMGFADILHPDDLERTSSAIRSMVRRGEPVERFENRIRTADGDYLWISWNAQTFGDEGVVYSTGRDVSQERSDRIFRETQNAVLTAIVDGAPLEETLTMLVRLLEEQDPGIIGSILLYDEATGVVHVAAAPSMAGSFCDAIEGQPVGPAAGSCGTAIHRREMVVVGDIATDPLWAAYRDVALEHDLRACWSLPVFGSEGEVLGTFAMYSREVCEPTADQIRGVADAVGLASIAIQSSHAQESLARSEERFRLLAEVITDAIWDWDLVSGNRWRSDGFRTLFGHSPEEMDPSDEWWQSKVHPEDLAETLASRQRALDSGADLWLSDYRFECADGRYADVTVRGRIVRDDEGRAVRMIGGMSDVSERRQIEKQYLRAQRVESLGTMAGGIAHDLNNSLMPILMATELLQTEELTDDARETVDVIAASARRSAEMVRNILMFARGIDGAHSTLTVDEVVHGVVRLVRDTFPKHVELVLEGGGSDLRVRGDATQLHQVLMNLALNARDAMPDGGRLTIAVEEVDVDGAEVDLVPGRYVVISVTDTGVGIAPVVMDRLFEPFFTTKPRAEGSGLGLPTSLAIVRSHAGGLEVRSEPGAGTTVEVYLPAVIGDAATDVPAAPAPPVDVDDLRGDGSVIMVVDDEASVRGVVRDVLTSVGYEVVEAGSGAVALEQFRRRGDITVVLTDIMMPAMDGARFVTELRRQAPDVPVIAMTGLDDVQRSGSLAAAGVLAVLAKPFDRRSLLAIVRDARPSR